MEDRKELKGGNVLIVSTEVAGKDEEAIAAILRTIISTEAPDWVPVEEDKIIGVSREALEALEMCRDIKVIVMFYRNEKEISFGITDSLDLLTDELVPSTPNQVVVTNVVDDHAHVLSFMDNCKHMPLYPPPEIEEKLRNILSRMVLDSAGQFYYTNGTHEDNFLINRIKKLVALAAIMGSYSLDKKEEEPCTIH